MKEGVLFALLVSCAYFQKGIVIPAFLLLLCYLVRYRRKWFICFFLIAVSILSCFLLLRVQNSEYESYGFDEAKVASVTGRVAEDSVVSLWGRRSCVIKLLECNLKSGDVATAKGRVRVSYSGSSLYAGDIVRFSGRFSDSGFNAKSFTLIRRLPVTRVREKFISMVLEHIGGDDEERELSVLLLLGIKSDPESTVSELARKSGNSHILALSGMHLSLFTWMLSALLTPVFGKRYARLISLSLLLLYILMIGPKPSLLRAFILSLVFFVFSPEKGIDALVFCFVIQLVLLPDTVLTLSSLLSYLSLSGIISVTGQLVSAVDAFVIVPEKPLSALFATVSALLFTVPVSYHVFGSYQLSSLLTSPVTGIIIYLYMIFSIISLFVPPAAEVCSCLYDALIFVMEKGASAAMFETLDGYYVLFASAVLILFSGLIKRRMSGYPKSHVEP